ncbi:SPOR domain-containing protein [Hydrogenovibrio sp. 3SP14C1]|uniref:SPOR domain-containing protein n=1 Tax=Hydrogenovibrio sp. 3SP14C1 TaxID=3038774 RepID=UPI002415CB19|nr:SPOR domain-containing protein [Hydrogenovibrio sp. 3SP14C1]MDG4813161.1 SPOR domain-containing protein [Hydrogenovibrio sp. 3SP14C1]
MIDLESDQDLSNHTVLKYRLTGAIFWLGLLVIIVPIWYSNPVNFDPIKQDEASVKKSVLIEKPFVLPQDQTKETTDKKIINHSSEEQVKSSSQKNDAMAQKEKALSDMGKSNISRKSADVEQYEWIIRLVAYRKKELAEALQTRLKYDYETFVKHFPENDYYSVRVGPYISKAEAIKDQQRLDRILRIQSELVKLKQSPK